MWRAILTAVMLVCCPAFADDFRSFEGHGGPVKAVRVSPDGKRMLTASFDYSIGLWDLVSETGPRWLEGHRAAVNCVAFLPGGMAVSGGDDFDVILWDLATQQPLRRFQGHKGKVMAVAATADRKRIASASWDGTIRVWDVATGDLLADLDVHEGNVNDVVWSADGSRFYSASYDGTVVEWDGRDYVPLRRLASHGFGVNVLALNDAAGWIAYGALDGGTRVLEIETGREIVDLTADRRPVLALAQAADGSKIAVGDGHGYIMVVDTDIWRISRDFRAALHGPIWALDFTPSGTGVIAGGIADEAYLWPLEGGDSQPRMAEIRRQFHVDPSKVSNGERQFLRKCSICHTLGADGERRAGPPLAGLFGRPAGAVAGYNYSDAVRNSRIVWSEETINKLFDLGPDHYLPGTNMPMQRIVSEEDRADLIEFLKRETAEGETK